MNESTIEFERTLKRATVADAVETVNAIFGAGIAKPSSANNNAVSIVTPKDLCSEIEMMLESIDVMVTPDDFKNANQSTGAEAHHREEPKERKGVEWSSSTEDESQDELRKLADEVRRIKLAEANEGSQQKGGAK